MPTPHPQAVYPFLPDRSSQLPSGQIGGVYELLSLGFSWTTQEQSEMC